VRQHRRKLSGASTPKKTVGCFNTEENCRVLQHRRKL
jgi:hypothetical protein